MTMQPEKAAAVARARDDLAAEHEALRGLVAKLRAPRRTQHEAFGLLEELHRTLAEHFAREEYPGGLYEAMGACTLEHGDDVRVLADDHFVILSTAQSLKERARGSAGPDAGFDRDLAALADRIAAHERREHDLVAKLA